MIDHPNPEKSDNMLLFHSFVEAPTAGENMYRFRVTAKDCQAFLQLPDYYKFLNIDEHISMTPTNHFGNGYGLIDDTQSCVNFTTDANGDYDVLIMATRKDIDAIKSWNGVERINKMERAFIV